MEEKDSGQKRLTLKGFLKALAVIVVILVYSFFLAIGASTFANRALLLTIIEQASEISALREFIEKKPRSSYTEIVKTIKEIPKIITNQQPVIPNLPDPSARSRQGTQTTYIEPSYDYTASELFAQVNAFRAQNDRKALEEDSCLCSIANVRKDELVLAGELDAHKGFENRDIFGTCPNFTFMGENLAQGYLDAQGVVFEGWAKSEGHRYAMDREEFTHGCAATEEGISVLILGGKASQ